MKRDFCNETKEELHGLEGYQRSLVSTRKRKRRVEVALYVTFNLVAELLHTDEIFESKSLKLNNSENKK